MNENDQLTFIDVICYQIDPIWRRLPEKKRDASKQEFSNKVDELKKTTGLRQYLSYGLRNDTDFFIWLYDKDLAKIQEASVVLGKTHLGTYLKTQHAYVGMAQPPIYAKTHQQAFEKGDPPLKYVFVYPFVKSRDWYLLPLEQRQEIMNKHITVGREFPTVRLNTTYSFGLGDQDFVLAFESDHPRDFEALVQKLRETQSSKYTVRDTPLIIGTYKSIQEVLEALG